MTSCIFVAIPLHIKKTSSGEGYPSFAAFIIAKHLTLSQFYPYIFSLNTKKRFIPTDLLMQRNRQSSSPVKAMHLLQLCDHQMGRNRPRAACKGGNCEGSSRPFRIADGQNRIDNRSFHNSHSHNLGYTRCAPCHRIIQILSIQCKNQLAGFRHTYLEEHLIHANIRQHKRICAGTGNAGAAVGPILRKTHIGAGSNRCSVITGHQRIEIRIIEHTASRAGRTRFTNGTLRTNGACFTYGTLRTSRACFTYGALRTNRTCFTNGALGTSRTCCTNGTLRTDGAGFTYGALGTSRTCCTYGALRTSGTCFTNGTLGTDGTRFTYGALGTDGTCFTYGALRTDRTRCTYGALRTDGTLFANGTLRTDRTCFTGRTLRTSGACFTYGALGANGALRASSTLRTGWACYTRRSPRPNKPTRTGFPNRTLRADRTAGAGRTRPANGTACAGCAWLFLMIRNIAPINRLIRPRGIIHTAWALLLEALIPSGIFFPFCPVISVPGIKIILHRNSTLMIFCMPHKRNPQRE